MIEDVTEYICMMPVQFGPRLFGPPELFGWSQNVRKIASIWPEPNAKPVLGPALDYDDDYDYNY